jgi:lipooligosaccharide transport system permease protein
MALLASRAPDRSTVRPTRLALYELSYQLRRYRRTWRGSVVVSVVNPLLFLLAIGVGLGKVIANHPPGLHGATYLQFFAPGMLAAAAMQNGIVESAFPVSRAVRPGGSYSVTASTPLDATDIMLGHSLFMAFKVALGAATFVAVMACFGAARSWLALLAIPAAMLTGLAFATPTMAWAATVKNPRVVFGAFKWVVMPLYLFSGTFFPVVQLPGLLRALAYATPLWHGVDLCRTLCLGTATWGRTAGHVGYLLVFTVAGLFLAARTYRRRLYA